jgi:hypothetical protein
MTSLKISMIPLFGLLLVSSVAIAGSDDIAHGRILYLDYFASCYRRKADEQGPVAATVTKAAHLVC